MTEVKTWLMVLIFLVLPSCSVFQLGKHDNFWDWYIGEPGYDNMLTQEWYDVNHDINKFIKNELLFGLLGKMGDRYLVSGRGHTSERTSETKSQSRMDWFGVRPVQLKGTRSPIFGHFRLPEILFQPAGGLTYPEREVARRLYVPSPNRNSPSGWDADGIAYILPGHRIKHGDSKYGMSFEVMEGGLIDNLIPYRYLSSHNDPGSKFLRLFFSPVVAGFALTHDAVSRIPYYAVHDVLKTAMIPVAAIYYLVK